MKYMMKYTFIILFLLLGVFNSEGKQTDSPWVIEHLGLKDGLSNNFVTDITQDDHGFIWIGTIAGLNRFDGENFKIFSERNTVLKGNSINSLFYDGTEDKLWIGSMKGLDVLDCRTQTFEDLKLPDNLGSINIVDIERASDGGIYIVNHYDFILHYKDGKYDVWDKDYFPGLPQSFLTMADDCQGHLYIGHVNWGFSVVNLKTRTVENFVHDADDAESLPGNNVNDIHIDRYGNIWLGTDEGLALFNPITRKFSTFLHDDKSTGTTTTHNVYSITESSDGIVWIGSDIGGVSTLDIRDLSLSNPDRFRFNMLPTTGDRNGISSMNVHKVFQDSFGNIWIGNYSEGLDFISRSQPDFNLLPYFSIKDNRIKEKPVWSVYTDDEGKLWIGGENEIAVFKKGKLDRIYDLSKYLKSPREGIYALLRIKNEILISAFEDGIFTLDINSGAVRRISAPGDRNYANCFAMLPGNKVYMGMQNGFYEYSDGKIRRMEIVSSAISNLAPNGIAIDRQGNLWLGTYGDGIFIFNDKGKLLHHLDDDHGLISNAVKSFYMDSRGWIWIAGQDGLSRISDTKHPHDIVNYDYDSGLNDIHIRALQEDNEGNVWFCTNNGLSKWNVNTSKIDNYDYHDGLPQSSFMDRAACKTPDGNLYFGSLNGICVFRPENFIHSEERIPVQIVECQNIFDPNGGLVNVNVSADGQSELKIPYKMNSLRIVFSVPDYSLSRVVKYSYKVEGLDNDWVMAGREHEATLRNLPPGTYTFKVRAHQRNQDWNDINVSALKISVTPPIWLTWYAKIAYALIFILIALIIVNVYKHRLLLQNSLEMERRKSIDEQQLNNERLRFYTNITHELRTPLTLILGPLEDLVSDAQLPDQFKNKIKTIHASALRLLNLINQILEFRKTETQNRRLAVAKGQISSVVTEIGLRYKELNHNDKVSINLNIENDVPEIYFDSDVIHTILNNLLSNAVKYTPAGSINLSLSTIRNDNGNYVEIAVADTGYGIDEKSLPHIFDSYYQAEGKHQASGTGIGAVPVEIARGDGFC